jgi:hypothetical protein
MGTHKTQFDVFASPPLDGFNSDEDNMSLGGTSHNSGQSSFSNSSSLHTTMSRNKSQVVLVFLGTDHCHVYVHS